MKEKAARPPAVGRLHPRSRHCQPEPDLKESRVPDAPSVLTLSCQARRVQTDPEGPEEPEPSPEVTGDTGIWAPGLKARRRQGQAGQGLP